MKTISMIMAVLCSTIMLLGCNNKSNVTLPKTQDTIIKHPVFASVDSTPIQITKAPISHGSFYTAQDGKKYQIHVGAHGGKYVIMTSQKTGKQYNRYLKK